MRYGVSIVIQMDENAHGGTFTLTRGSAANAPAVAESKAIHMEPSQAGASEEEEDIVAEGDDKRPQRRKRRRRRGRGDGDAAFQNGASLRSPMPEVSTKAAKRRRRRTKAKKQRRYWPAQRASPALRKRPRLRMAESDQEFRRNRRRGRRGGRRHREELAGGAESAKQPGEHIPGLGEQPILDFDVHFPKSGAFGPASLQPAVQEKPAMAQEPALTGSAPQPVPEPALPEPAMKAAPQPGPASAAASAAAGPAAEAAPEPAPEAAPEPAPVAEAPVIAEPVQAPKPKPVKAGPPRKGWWQRRTG